VYKTPPVTFALLALAASAWSSARYACADPPPMTATATMLEAPEARPADGFEAEGLSPVFYRGLPWKGKPTEVFAWIGMPKVEPGRKVPGIVLVHGGGGTAFEAWVRLWVGRGYAAIAMDTCGTVPRGTYGKWERHEAGGPPGNDFSDALSPPEDQWPYHAVADVLLAHSLLRSRPEVDPERVGLTGISWGGYLTCIASGLDPRFRFAVPVYGCGFLGEDSVWKDEIQKLGPTGDRWLSLWDPSHYLPLGKMPKLWVTGTNDFAYPLVSLRKSYRVAGGDSTLSIRLRMPHGHGGAGENPEEIRAFADSILNGSPDLPRVGPLTEREGRVVAQFESPRKLEKAELLFTTERGDWPKRTWQAVDAQVDAVSGHVSASPPRDATAYFINLLDDRGLVVSTPHHEAEDAAPR